MTTKNSKRLQELLNAWRKPKQDNSKAVEDTVNGPTGLFGLFEPKIDSNSADEIVNLIRERQNKK
tara:strand:- start:13462 stop:13656 length:195 start_codon:yes stop_codon:yes gene_type:complete